MRVIPAIDLMSGQLTRLSKGDPETAKHYKDFENPVEAALYWEREGARLLHVIDLDAAMGRGDNRGLIKEILGRVKVPVQVGGGLRSPADVLDVLGLGAARALVGTLALESPDEFDRLLAQVGSGRLVVALDYVEDRVVIRGWKQRTELRLTDSLRDLTGRGVATFLLTDVRRDGLMAGPDLETLSRCVGYRGARIIAAGGIGSLDDLRRLGEVGVDEVVVGKALYEGRFTLREALALFPD